MTQPTPLFIFSLPRAGSTLLQRILSAHDRISTVAEPWVLLPLMYTLRREGMYAEYSHRALVAAIEDFCKELPGGQDAYRDEMRGFVTRLYARASREGAAYFLDKTPRYHLIADEVIKTFPGAKFIFLWRNPLAVTASIMETWNAGKWDLYRWKVDLYDGTANLVKTWQANSTKALSVRYEDLLESPEETCGRIFDYLGLEFKKEILVKFSGVNLSGRLGDETGVKKYKSLNSEPLDKWKKTLLNPIRKTWSANYLKWLGPERLSAMGYELDTLLAELKATPFSMSRVPSDAARLCAGALYSWGEPVIMRDKLRMLPKFWRVHAHR